MKVVQLRVFVTTAIISIVFGSSCQKEQSNDTSTVTELQKMGGLVEDDPSFVSKVPLVISQELSLKDAYSGTIFEVTANARPGGSGGGGGKDNTPPTVSITSPANGAVVSGTVALTAVASDNVGVSSVRFSIDGVNVMSITVPPYNYNWNSASVVNGNHTITATATDARNNSRTATITVGVNTPVIIVPPPTNLPSSYFLATPPISNQGNELTCTPFASVYAARSIEQYYRTAASSFSGSTNIFSPEYVYNQTKISDCNSGTSIGLTLDLMKNKGVCTWQTMPYSDANGCSSMPSAAQDAEAANYKIGGYSKIMNTDRNAIKAMLYSNHPVIASITMDNGFINAGPTFIWSSYSGSGALPHCLIICGYDDAKNAYKVMSSWGTSWGDAGFSWISYDYFPVKSGYYVYVMNY